jgi:hypothetical protein
MPADPIPPLDVAALLKLTNQTARAQFEFHGDLDAERWYVAARAAVPELCREVLRLRAILDALTASNSGQ